jgi:Heparan-alpha-glucosaminide N-acetyltransferase, catalytic
VARCLALLGMVATHVLAERDPDGSLSLGQALAGGRASALFAVLAGLSIALVTGRTRPFTGTARARASTGLLVRALVVAAIGLLLGAVDSGIAVILAHYGVLFVMALPFVGMSARALGLLAAGWLVVAPVLSQVVRPALPERQFASPTFDQLVADPGGLLAELTFTGYYPAVPWLACVLAGMAVGRLDLGSRRTAALLAAGGAAAAVLATVVSRVLTARSSVQEALLTRPPAPDVDATALLDRISSGLFGTTPTDGAWQWLLVVAPHTATPFDLLQTIGSALLVIGLALLVVDAVGPTGRRATAVFFGAGTMTLTLYSVHVVARSRDLLPDGLRDSYLFHVLLLLGIGSVFAATRTRGPLEMLVGGASRGLSGRPRT